MLLIMTCLTCLILIMFIFLVNSDDKLKCAREDFARYVHANKKNNVSIINDDLLKELTQEEEKRIVSHETTILKVVDDTFTTSGGIPTHYTYHNLTWEGFKIKCGKNTFNVLISKSVRNVIEMHGAMATWLNGKGKKSLPTDNSLERIMSSLCKGDENTQGDEHQVIQDKKEKAPSKAENILERFISSQSKGDENTQGIEHQVLQDKKEEKNTKDNKPQVFQVWCKNQLVALGNVPVNALS